MTTAVTDGREPRGDVGLSPLARLPLLILALLGLIGGLAGGLSRLGVSLPMPTAHASIQHGVLMVCGFFGTLICLERAVALKHRWAYAAPLASAAGALLLAAGESPIGAALLVLAGALFCIASGIVHARQPVLFTKVLLAGAACWTLGNILLATNGWVHAAEPWWIAFFVLTIAGERLELNRMLAPKRGARASFVVVVAVLLVGATLTSFDSDAHTPVFAAALAAMALWLVHNDIARRTVHAQGLPRYIAVSLLSGYGWLLGAAVLSGWSGSIGAPLYMHDAFLHAVFVGFVFSMVFGHAPIILPAVLGIRLRYTAWLYLPLAVLHLSLVCRIGADLATSASLRTFGGVLNAFAVVMFAAAMIYLLATARTAGARRR